MKDKLFGKRLVGSWLWMGGFDLSSNPKGNHNNQSVWERFVYCVLCGWLGRYVMKIREL